MCGRPTSVTVHSVAKPVSGHVIGGTGNWLAVSAATDTLVSLIYCSLFAECGTLLIG